MVVEGQPLDVSIADIVVRFAPDRFYLHQKMNLTVVVEATVVDLWRVVASCFCPIYWPVLRKIYVNLRAIEFKKWKHLRK